MNMDCLFCKIVNGDIPAEIVKNTERVTAFKDISPQAPVHILVIPNSHFDNMAEGQGAAMALPIWALYMKKVLADPRLGYSVDDQFDVPAEYGMSGGCD